MKPKLRIAIVGAGGRLGTALVREYGREHDVTGFNHAQLDLGDSVQLRAALETIEFDALINCAAQTNVDRCETHRDEAMQLNAEAPRIIAQICRAKKARLIHISTDYVFDGEAREPYREEDEARPISIYGESKREGERLALEANDEALVARVSWVFGPDRPSFIDGVLNRARESESVSAVADKFSAPTYTKDIAAMLRPFLADHRQGGLLHLANRGECSWREYAQWALDCCHEIGLPMQARTVEASSLSDMKNFAAKRPVYTVLSTAKYEQITGREPRDWHTVVREYVETSVAAALK